MHTHTYIYIYIYIYTGASPGFGRGGQEFFLKWCNLVSFGVYFDRILSLKNFKNHHFLYKIFKNFIFFYKRMHILDTRLLCGNNYCCEEIF